MSGNQNAQARGGQDLSITERYSDRNSFIQMLERIGVSIGARNKLVDDDFTSMKSLVGTYSNDVEGFHSYMKGVNKTFGGRSIHPIHFSPIVMKRMIGTLFHFTQAVGCFHCIPNIGNIDAASCYEFI